MSYFETILQSQWFVGSDAESFDLANVSARDFRHIELRIDAENGSDFWVRVKGSLQVYLPAPNDLVETPPDFTSAADINNSWEYVDIIDLSDGNSIPGATGYHVTADGTYMFEVNTNALAWVAFEVFDYTTGDYQGQFTFKNNA